MPEVRADGFAETGAGHCVAPGHRYAESNERAIATAAGGRLQFTFAIPEEEYVARVLSAEASNFQVR